MHCAFNTRHAERDGETGRLASPHTLVHFQSFFFVFAIPHDIRSTYDPQCFILSFLRPYSVFPKFGWRDDVIGSKELGGMFVLGL